MFEIRLPLFDCVYCRGIIFPLRKKPEFAITASRWGLNACVWVIISLLYTCPWIACECFGSWILGIGVTGQTVWPLVVPFECRWYFFWVLIYYDSWCLVREALDVFLGSPGSVLTRQRCLCPRCCQRWWHPKNMMILSWERRDCRHRMITMSCTCMDLV